MSRINNDQSSPFTHNIGQLLNDPAFQSMLKGFSQKCISWDEFLSQSMPLGISPLEMWDIMNRLGRFMSLELPIPDLNDQRHWYRRTYELTDLISKVTYACSPDSYLHRMMTSAGSQHFLMNVRIQETMAATRFDGFSISMHDANILLRLDRAPRNATERLVMNTFNSIDHLSEFIDKPFSKALFEELRECLLEGVDIRALKTTRPSLGTGLFDWSNELTQQFANRQMDYIAAYANHETGSEHDHHALRALILADSFRFYRPLKEVSYQVGCLVAHLYALKHELPILGLLPASCAKLEWDQGRINPPQVSFDRATFESLRRRSPGDLTSLQTLSAQLMLLALKVVEHYVAAWESRDQELRHMLKKDPGLNDRQRTILGRALRKPEAEFTIRYHKNNHGIAYPTARRDFLELVEKDYLTMQQRGKAFIFMPSKQLHSMFTTDAQTLSRLRELDIGKSFFSL